MQAGIKDKEEVYGEGGVFSIRRCSQLEGVLEPCTSLAASFYRAALAFILYKQFLAEKTLVF